MNELKTSKLRAYLPDHVRGDVEVYLKVDADVEITRLKTVLQGAVEIIKTWHNMSRIGLRGDPTLEGVWDIYWQNAPEMKPIREALAQVLGASLPAGPGARI